MSWRGIIAYIVSHNCYTYVSTMEDSTIQKNILYTVIVHTCNSIFSEKDNEVGGG